MMRKMWSQLDFSDRWRRKARLLRWRTDIAESHGDRRRQRKHLPMDRREGTVRVDVGEISHPMEDDHLIEWIYLQTERGGQFVRLRAGEEPRATFGVSAEAPGDAPVAVFSYCNKHGLWKTDLL